jgi:thiamine biosynthesis lipoprotein
MRVASLCGLLLLLNSAPSRAEWHTDTREMMGTRVELQLWAADDATGRKLIAAGMAEFARIEAALSTYRDSSEISAVNREAALRPVPASAELHVRCDGWCLRHHLRQRRPAL